MSESSAASPASTRKSAPRRSPEPTTTAPPRAVATHPLLRVLGGAAAVLLLFGLVAADEELARPWCSTALVVGLSVLAAQETVVLLMRRFEGEAPRRFLATGVLAFASARAFALDRGIAGEVVALRGLVVLVAAAMLLEVLRGDPRRGGPRLLAVSFACLVAACLGYLLDLLWTAGVSAAVLVVLTAKASDMGGYIVGKAVGGPKIAPRISPNKTISGSLGGWAFSLAVALAGPALVFDPVPSLLWRLAFGTAVAATALLGDLGESLLKRWLGAKDSGRLVPTFGGVLDLVDSLVLAVPVGYWFVVGFAPPAPA